MSIKMKLRGLFASALLAMTMAAPTQSYAVNNALFLALDGSGSISGAQWTLQTTGTVSALNTVFGTGNFWGTAVGALQFASGTSLIATTSVINNAADLAALTAAIGGEGQTGGGTNIPNAINVAAADLLAFEGANGPIKNKVIDVSTDGFSSGDPAAAANAALANGITTNCLGVGAGANCNFETGFEVLVANFSDFENALVKKIQRELGVPEPGIAALMAIGLLGFGFVRRRSA